MKLFDLKEHLECGGEVRRRAWDLKGEPGLKLREHWSISTDSIFADDWEPVGEKRGCPIQVVTDPSMDVDNWKLVTGAPATFWEQYDDEGEEHA